MQARSLKAVTLGLVFLSVAVQSIEVHGQPDDLRLDNGQIEFRMDLASGGAITYFGVSGESRNLVNNYDRGRQIQQSYYAGQLLDRTAEGQHAAWSPWPWNPIQVGDAYGNSAQVIDSRVNNGEAYSKTIPLLWDMNNQPAECTFETWVTLEGNVAHVRNRVDIFRTDAIWTSKPRHQELPAVYTISELSRLVTYIGDRPWQNDDLTTITRIGIPGQESFPWNYWPSPQYPGRMIERWAATVDEGGWGVGVFYRDAELFVGGRYGSPGGGEFSSSTMYMSPLRTMTFGRTELFEYEYDLIVGTLSEIRQYVYDQMDCNANGSVDEGDIASGTSQDCNGNRVPDSCDIASATSLDCTSNGIPDECELDCNGNGTADSCDIAIGTEDLNENGVPDECDAHFLRGDCNVDRKLDISDGVSNLNALFGDGVPSDCVEACDANDDAQNDVSDAVYVFIYLFGDGAPPAAPYPACGEDPEPAASLGCGRFGCE